MSLSLFFFLFFFLADITHTDKRTLDRCGSGVVSVLAFGLIRLGR